MLTNNLKLFLNIKKSCKIPQYLTYPMKVFDQALAPDFLLVTKNYKYKYNL